MSLYLIVYLSLSIGATLGFCVGALLANSRHRPPAPYRRIDPGRD